jgi:hypothetical protein
LLIFGDSGREKSEIMYFINVARRDHTRYGEPRGETNTSEAGVMVEGVHSLLAIGFILLDTYTECHQAARR